MSFYPPSIDDALRLGLADAPSLQLLGGSGIDGVVPAFDATFELSSLDGSNGFVIDGGRKGDLLGASVASAGDLNGDGYADLIVGAEKAGNSGASYVVFGHAGGFDAAVDISQLDGEAGFSILGSGHGSFLGKSVASAGDINGDGYDDVIVGAPLSSQAGSDSGASYVVFGHAGGFDASIPVASLNGSNGFRLDGVAGETSGWSVASAGDVNGDGFSDLIVGAESAGSNGQGASYVVFGKASGFAAALDLSTLSGADGFRINGVADFDESGSSVTSAGDVNGDGYADLIIGAPYADPHGAMSGSSYVVFGKASGFAATLDLASLSGSDGFRIDGAAAGDLSGYSVASAGDINGDGFADIVVGAYRADPHANYSGSSYVIFGKASGFAATLDLSSLDGVSGLRLDGGASDNDSGVSVASAGDVNGDGFDDLIIGATGVSFAGQSAGASYIVYGKASGFDADINLSSLNGADGFRIDGVAALDRSGFSVASAGDVNGDGLADLIIGAPGDGASYVVFGQAPTTAVHLTGTDASQSLVGGELKDVLLGLGGDDMLWGHGGKDRLTGGSGNDTLIGGAGKDVLIGGVGADVFAYKEVGDSDTHAADTLKALGKTDAIDLSAIDADVNTDGDQAFHMVSSFTGQAGELTLAYDAGSKLTLLQGDVDGDGVADFVVHITGDHHDFSNFVL